MATNKGRVFLQGTVKAKEFDENNPTGERPVLIAVNRAARRSAKKKQLESGREVSLVKQTPKVGAWKNEPHSS